MPVRALQGIDMEIAEGEYVAIMGPSGSGKSTLLHVIGCLDRPTAGHYYLEGRDVSRLDDRDLSTIRNRRLGFVFQAYNLVPQLTVIENVELPLFYMGVSRAERLRRSMELIQMVGLRERAKHRPSQLSGGETQRVAIARALVNQPALVVADEPTGNLDSQTGEDVLKVIDELHSTGRTILMVTHDVKISLRSQRVVHIRDGKIEREVNTAAWRAAELP